jgi:serine/threonine protein kinase
MPALSGCRSIDCYEKLNRIDEGTYGIVWRARDRETGDVVALKQVKPPAYLFQERAFLKKNCSKTAFSLSLSLCFAFIKLTSLLLPPSASTAAASTAAAAATTFRFCCCCCCYLQVKIIPEHGDEGFPITFLREITALLEMRHPNIINVKEICVWPGDLDKVFMVMEYMDADLRHLMNDMNKPFSQAEVKGLMVQVQIKSSPPSLFLPLSPLPLLSLSLSLSLSRSLSHSLSLAFSLLYVCPQLCSPDPTNVNALAPLQLLSALDYTHAHWLLHRDLKTTNILFNNQGVLKVCPQLLLFALLNYCSLFALLN